MAAFIDGATVNILSSYLCDQKLEVRLSHLHADGVVARRSIHTGETIYAEKPLCFLQTIPNAQDVLICGQCQTVLGDLNVQVSVLSKTVSREDINAQGGCCQCQAKCGVLYCSDECNQKHWSRGHKLLCTGYITDEDAENSPLMNFKIHACATNEIFLLVADLFSNICCEVDRMRSEGKLDEKEIITAALFPYSTFVRNPWWEVAIPSRTGDASSPEESPEQFAATLQQLVHDSWDMLEKVLDLNSRGLSEILCKDYMARTIGMFEQNNIGVRCDHPIASIATSLVPQSDLVAPILSAVETISQYLEGQEGSESDWIDAEDDDDEDDDESNEMDECEDEACCEGDHNHDHEHSHGHQHEHEAMDDEETGDASLDKLKSLIRENGMESLFPPLDGTALYSMMCKINHSCYPNVRVKYVFAREYGLVAELVALREIRPDDELLQSYIDQTMDTDARQAALADYGFRCTCIRCSV